MEKAISDCCNHNDKKREKPPRYCCNPYEVGVVVPRGPERERLLASLVNKAFPGRRPALVTRGLKALSEQESRDLGTQCVVNGRQRVLVHTADDPEFVDVEPLLAADFALVADDRAKTLPSLVFLDAPDPPQDVHAIAYVGKPSLCPVLPSSADYFVDTDIPSIGACVMAYFESVTRTMPLYGLVLTGGRSTRMQKDKSALNYHGAPQVQYCVDLLKEHCSNVFVSCRPEQANEPHLRDFDQVHDAFIGFGPMGGILSAQKERPNAAWLVLACDLPFVDEATMAHLIANRNPFKLATAYIGSESKLPEPLCAIYEPKSLHRLLAFLGKGYHCPRKVLINSDSNLIELPHPHALDNANSPDEYEAAIAAISNGATAK